jgi:hypothetical protein
MSNSSCYSLPLVHKSAFQLSVLIKSACAGSRMSGSSGRHRQQSIDLDHPFTGQRRDKRGVKTSKGESRHMKNFQAQAIQRSLKVCDCCDCTDLQRLSEYYAPLRGGECSRSSILHDRWFKFQVTAQWQS